jgi:hypothetical protein
MKADELGSSRLLVSEACVLATTEYEKIGLKNKMCRVKNACPPNRGFPPFNLKSKIEKVSKH